MYRVVDLASEFSCDGVLLHFGNFFECCSGMERLSLLCSYSQNELCIV